MKRKTESDALRAKKKQQITINSILCSSFDCRIKITNKTQSLDFFSIVFIIFNLIQFTFLFNFFSYLFICCFILSFCRDTLYRLTFGLEPIEKAVWEASASHVEMCQNKGPNENECRNYIKVLQSNGNQLYTCGTHAFSPACSWRQVRFDFYFYSLIFHFIFSFVLFVCSFFSNH